MWSLTDVAEVVEPFRLRDDDDKDSTAGEGKSPPLKDEPAVSWPACPEKVTSAASSEWSMPLSWALGDLIRCGTIAEYCQ